MIQGGLLTEDFLVSEHEKQKDYGGCEHQRSQVKNNALSLVNKEIW